METSLKQVLTHAMIFEEDSDESKKVVIVINLVEESLEKANEEIEKEILEELTDDMPIIPWLERVERVTVIEE